MALKPPPVKKDIEKEADAIINKGGKVAEKSPKEKKEEWTMITVRLPKIMLKDMDNEIDKRKGLSRNAWILEAIQDKL